MNEVTSTQLAIDGEIEERDIPDTVSDLETDTNCPDLPRLDWRLLTEEDDLTVVVLSNLESFPVERAHLALARCALDLPDAAARPRVSISAHDLARCAGAFQLADGFGGWTPWPIAADAGALTAPFPAAGSRYEPITPTEFQCVDDPEIMLHFHDLRDAGYVRVTIQGPMRWQWQTTTVNRAIALP